jgi:homopolymeric O-antigen transport system ATP-binding protein
MSKPIIICDSLGKSYRLGEKQRLKPLFNHSFTLREAMTKTIHSGIRFLKGERQEAARRDSTFWALRNVSFEVKRGEVIGLIGSNGAGKSTLLKIFSRIVEPTEGIVRLRGRIASLLEVGTGFHPELTGRENIYLNGAILGMRRAEINQKFDEIVAFSEIEKFLDTPVKRYSSGMYIRLAFAVAAHLEPDILVVDEVLAVGDHAFQQKCLGKMRDVATGHGRTILFVSHNMGALAQLCEYGILLEQGEVKSIGPVRDVIQTYLRSSLSHDTAQARFPTDTTKPCQFVSAEFLHNDGSPGSEFGCDEPVIIRLCFEVREASPGTVVAFHIQNLEGVRVLFSDIRDTNPSVANCLGVGRHVFEINIPPRLLAPTTYVLTISSTIHLTDLIDEQEACCEFTLRDMSHRVSLTRQSRFGVLGLRLPWEHRHSFAKGALGSQDTVETPR